MPYTPDSSLTASTQFAVDGADEPRQITQIACEFETRARRQKVFWQEWALLADDTLHVEAELS